MTLIIELSTEQEERLRQQAKSRGLDESQYVRNLIVRDLPPKKKRKVSGYGKFAHINISSDDVEVDRIEDKAKDERAFVERFGRAGK